MLILLLLLNVVVAQNYCDQALCPNGRDHIGCKNNGAFSANCPANARVIPIGKYLKYLIVDLHNAYRNVVASGLLQGFRQAVRMASMQWDDELAKLASLSVKRCVSRRDLCHGTKKFHYSGQNIHTYSWDDSITYVPLDDIVVFGVKSWYEEHKNATMAQMNRYPQNRPSKEMSSFARFVQEKNTHIGCGIVRFRRNGQFHQIMICNYAYKNVYNRPVYRRGPKASQCKTGVYSAAYNGLCSTYEIYNVNSLHY